MRLIDANDVDNHIVGSVNLSGCPTINAIPIPEDATNGEVLKEVFPNAKYDYHEECELVDAHVIVSINDCDTCQDYSMDWWNAKYKGVE